VHRMEHPVFLTMSDDGDTGLPSVQKVF